MLGIKFRLEKKNHVHVLTCTYGLIQEAGKRVFFSRSFFLRSNLYRLHKDLMTIVNQ
jgi:hypothetical protein